MKESLYDSYWIMGWKEYVSVWIIVLASGWYDFENCIIIGIVVSIMLAFLTFCSRNVITKENHGDLYHHDDSDQLLVKSLNSRILIYKVQSYLFFGNAPQVEMIKNELSDVVPKSFIILDFENVSGMDYSFAYELVVLRNFILHKECWFMLTNVKLCILPVLHRLQLFKTLISSGKGSKKPLYTSSSNEKSLEEGWTPTDYIFDNLDDCVEWCEKCFLAS